ncbi:hypothetical protein [Paracoccus fistulariae]|uniref:Uncharacterized protein n=1 Tax=Paracoccus fistulariae TaxID=658446 RepID=A0ABY7SPR5_9RHOB|nr:hypothetical protein [Paracoccus fistulariae]MDB6182772.1 hypothetical protein [Paracoccus fistulariae]WCR08883.1 hypothetical protein JHX87_08905 [Paracoccus fistulariae]
MFRLFRRAIFLMLIFFGGMVYERMQQQDKCETSGGIWQRAGFCQGG